MKKKILVVLLFFFTFFISINVKAESLTCYYNFRDSSLVDLNGNAGVLLSKISYDGKNSPKISAVITKTSDVSSLSTASDYENAMAKSSSKFSDFLDSKPQYYLKASDINDVRSLRDESTGKLVCPTLFLLRGEKRRRQYQISLYNSNSFDVSDINAGYPSTGLVTNVNYDSNVSTIDNSNSSGGSSSTSNVATTCTYNFENFNYWSGNSIKKASGSLTFSILNDGTVANAAALNGLTSYEFKYAGAPFTSPFACPNYLKFKEGGYNANTGRSTIEFSVVTTSSEASATKASTVGGANDNGVSVVYLAWNSASAPKIFINSETSGKLKTYTNETTANTPKDIQIGVDSKDKNLSISNIESAFKKKDTDNYPTWINGYLENGQMRYEFSNTKDDQYAKINYICQEKINSIYTPGEDPEATCETLFGSDFLKFLNSNVITIVRLGIPLLLILFTTFDFAKVVFVDDKEGIQKAAKRFGKRLIAAILVYLIPAILIWLVQIIGADKVDECSEFLNNLETEQTE